jgi:hypothetical protein
MCSGGAGYGSIETQSDEELARYQAPVAQEAGIDEEGNPLYSYGENHTYEQNLYDQAQAEISRRQQVGEQLETIAAERQATLEDQQRQMREMQQQQQREMQRQGQLQQQAEQDRLGQEQQIGRERMASQAMSQSMQVLGRAGKSGTAPTAQVTRGQARAKVRATSGSQGLRIGSSVTAPGIGLNIGG